MAKKYAVILSPTADAEITEAYLWIRQWSPLNAARWRVRLLKLAETLGEHPRRCPLAPEANSLGREIRQLLFGRYRILYVIQDGPDRVVRVIHIRHGARRHLTPDDEPASDN